jgi:arginine decarboxylase
VSEIPTGQAYNSWWQFRLDMWSRLEEASGRLAAAAARGLPTDDLAKTVADLLDSLTPLEPFWAFPGSEAYRRARDFFESSRYDRFERIVVRINRALVTESYRNGRGWTVIDGDHERVDTEGMVGEPTGSERPYFEVLVVESLTAAQEQSLREEVRSWRRPDDEFVYELVVVNSGEEAVMAARLNASLQACVIRRRFSHACARDLAALVHLVDSTVSSELANRDPDERAQILARRIARLRPEVDLYLMTEIAVEDMAGRLSHHFVAYSMRGKVPWNCT